MSYHVGLSYNHEGFYSLTGADGPEISPGCAFRVAKTICIALIESHTNGQAFTIFSENTRISLGIWKHRKVIEQRLLGSFKDKTAKIR